MPTIQIGTDELLNAALQLPQVELEQFITRLFSLKAKERAPVLSEREAELLAKIYQGLPPGMQPRLNKLIKKRRTETITPEELKELRETMNFVELHDAARLELLIELAHLRGVALNDLIKQLGLKPVPHD